MELAGIPAQSEAELIDGLWAVYSTKLVNIAAFSLLIYDYIITFRREQELIWKWKGFAWGKVLYLIQRYFTLAGITFVIVVEFTYNISTELYVCIVWAKFDWFAAVTIIMLAEIALQLRLYAMYGKTTTILAFLIITFISTFAIILVLISRVVAHSTAYFFDPIPGSSLYICAPLNVPAYFREVWIPLFVHEVLLMALAVFKGIQIAREHGKGGYMAHFTLFLVRDSVLYYFSLFAAFFSLELVWIIGGVNYIALPFVLAVVIGSIMSQRLLLKIRERFATHNSVRATMRRTMMDESESSSGSDTFALHMFMKV